MYDILVKNKAPYMEQVHETRTLVVYLVRGSMTKWWRIADHPISYLDTLIKTGSESIEATLHSRRVMFAGFVIRMEDTRLLKCVMLGALVGGASCVGGQDKEWMGCFLDDLRAFGINADQWTTAAQDEGEWRRTAEQGAECFMAKWIAAEKARARLRHAVVCPNVTGRT